MVFLESYSKLLLFMHFALTIILVGASAHNAYAVFGLVMGKAGHESAERRFAFHMLWSYIAVFIFGAMVYPAFRVKVRYDFFDKLMPWCTGLFEIKEHLASFGLALVFAYYIIGRNLDPVTEKGKLFYFYFPAIVVINAIVWYLAIAGFYLTSVRSV